MIKIIFFDFDGTISDAKKLALSTLIEVLEEHKYKFNRKKLDKALGDKMEIIFRQLKIPTNHLQQIRKEFYKEITKHVNKLSLCKPVSPLYKLNKKYRFIVVTNSESKFMLASAKKLMVKGLFSEIYGAEKFKSKDLALKMLFKKHNIKPGEAVYIGDRYSDIIFAKRAGCHSIAIHNKCSWSTLKEVKKERPDFIIKNFSQLAGVLKKLNNYSICKTSSNFPSSFSGRRLVAQ
jgi:phosphoglycolate phosphatase-like HAD superfamily hydrolase